MLRHYTSSNNITTITAAERDAAAQQLLFIPCFPDALPFLFHDMVQAGLCNKHWGAERALACQCKGENQRHALSPMSAWD